MTQLLAAHAARIAPLAVMLFATGAQAAPVAVTISQFAFAPKEITVAPGTTVVWTNKDETPHTVTGKDAGGPKSPAMDTDDRYEYTFTGEGDFSYFCTLHPFMTGIVHVHR